MYCAEVKLETTQRDSAANFLYKVQHFPVFFVTIFEVEITSDKICSKF